MRLAAIGAALVASACATARLEPRSVPRGATELELVSQLVPVGVVWTRAAVSDDGVLAVLGEGSGTLRVVDVTQGRVLRALRPHRDAVVALVVRPDGALVSAARDGSVCTVDLATVRVIACMRSNRTLAHLAVSPDGRRLVAADADRVRVFDIERGTNLRSFEAKEVDSTGWSQDGSRIAWSTRGSITVVRASSGALVGKFEGALDASLGFGGSSLLSTPDPAGVTGASRDGRWSLEGTAATGRISVRAGDVVRTAAFQRAEFTTGVITHDGEVLIGADWGVLRFDLRTGTIASTRMSAPVEAIGDSGRFVVTRTKEARTLHGLTRGRATELRKLGPAERKGRWDTKQPVPLALGCAPPGHCRVVEGGTLSDAAGGEAVQLPRFGNKHDNNERLIPSAIAISADGRRIARASPDSWRGVEILNTTNSSRIGELRADDVHALALSRDGAQLFVAVEHDRGGLKLDARANRILRIDVATGKVLATFPAPGVGVSTMAVSWDGKYLLVGGRPPAIAGERSDVLLLDAATGRRVRTLSGHRGSVVALSFAPTGTHALSVGTDGTARVWRIADGGSVAITAAGSQWLMFDDAGTFDASRNGARLVAAVEGRRVFAIDQLAVRNNRPDKLLASIGIGSAEVIGYFKRRHEARLAALGVREDQLAAAFAGAPVVTLDKVAGTDAGIEVAATLDSPSAPLTAYQVWVNQVPVFPAPQKASGNRAAIRHVIAASPGNNRVEVVASSANGLESRRVVQDVARPPGSGDLYFLGIGVSRYRDEELSLKFAAKDATDLAGLLSSVRAFARTHTKLLRDEQVTAKAIRDARDFVAAATERDTVIVFVAGHGTHSDDRDAEYLFVTHDFDPLHPRETAAPFSMIEGLLDGLAARKKLLLIDTCESGERDDETAPAAASGKLISRTARALKRVRAAEQVAPSRAAPARIPRPFVLDRDRLILTDLRLRSGTVVLAASRWNEDSYESQQWGNGAFTAELLAALASGDADVDGDGALSIEELVGHVTAAVATRTLDLQHPYLSQDNIDAAIRLPLAR